MKALTTLAQADGGLVTRDELFAAIWPNQDIADQTLSSLISQLRSHLSDSAGNPGLIGTVPKKGYRLLQPVYLTGRPDQPSLRQGNSATISAGRGRWLALLMLLAGLLAGVLMFSSPSKKVLSPIESPIALPAVPMAPTSIAVLPFANMSAEPDDSYFSDGIAEELLNQLAKVQGLRVVSRTSSFRFRAGAAPVQQRDIRNIGQQLNARYVLEGGVRREDDDVRVTVQLINAQTGYNSWSGTFDGKWQDLFSLQEVITRSVVDQISPQLLVEEMPLSRPATTEAYDFYLQGLYWWNQRTADSLQRSSKLFQQAIALDPEYALAYTGLAESYLSQHYYGGQSADRVVAKAHAELRRALALAPNLPEVNLALGNLFVLQTDWQQAEASLNRALKLDPSLAMAHMSLGNVYNQSGRLSEAYQSYSRAALLSPVHPTVAMNLTQVATKLGFYDIAIQHLKVVTRVAPDHPYLFGLETHVYISAGRANLVRQSLDQWLERQREGPQSESPAGQADAISCGRAAIFLTETDIARQCLETVVSDLSLTAVPQYQMEALTQLAWLENLAGNSERAQTLIATALACGHKGQKDMPLEEAIAFELGVAFALGGNVAMALQELRKSMELGRRDLGWLLNDRRLDSLRANADFALLTREMNDLQAGLQARSEPDLLESI